MRKFVLAIFLVSIGLVLPRHVFAASKGVIEVVPAYIDTTIASSESAKKVDISFINHSAHQVSLNLQPLDFKQQGEHGEIGFLGQQSDAYSYSLSSFLSLETNQITLEPGEKRLFAVTIQNREDLSPGGHYAAIIAKVDTSNASQSKTSVAPSLSSMLLIRKTGGERFNLSLVGSSWPQWISFKYPGNFDLIFQNEGNVHVIPYGKVEVHDMLGRVVAKGVINDSSKIVFPEVRRYIDATLIQLTWSLPVSFNNVVVKGQDSVKKAQYYANYSYVYLNPWFVILVVLLLVFGGFMLTRKRRRKHAVHHHA